MSSELSVSLVAISPIIVLSAWACVLLLVDLFIPKERKGWTAFLAALGLLVALIANIVKSAFYDDTISNVFFNGMIVVDGFSNFLNVLFLVSGLAGIALAYDYLRRTEIERGEYYILLLFTIVGMMLMSMSADLILVFLGLELLSIPLYVLAGIAVPRLSSEEASIKYFLLGAFSSGFFLYGTALLYGATGTTALKGILEAIETGKFEFTFLLAGGALILVGLGFKIAVVPFHMWTPDVYHGAPSSVAAFMTVGAKAAGFAVLLRVFILTIPTLSVDFTSVLWTISALTMIVGNVIAIAQKNIKRLLAYSSIAHAGYILMALVPYKQENLSSSITSSILFYLVAYAFTSFAAWAVVIALEKVDEKGLELEDYTGLGRKHPALAAVMTISMLSLTGVPPTLGFLGKFFLFQTVIEGGFLGLAIIGVLTSLVSAYYYLRLVVYMYMRDGEPEARKDPWLLVTAYGSAICIIGLSIFATPILYWISQAVLRL